MNQKGAEQPTNSASVCCKSTKAASDEDPSIISRPTLTPHTIRLLKLIEQGSSDHARMAVDHLKEITAKSSPLVLWEILGRLQGFLVSPEWRTRSNAGLAMEGVAQHLPPRDQEEFLTQDHRYHLYYRSSRKDSQDDEGSSEMDSISLKVSDLEGNLTTILAKGQILVATAESRYKMSVEDEELEALDQSSQGDENFFKLRLEMQRKILTKRLGLSTALAHYTTDCNDLNSRLIDTNDLQVRGIAPTGSPEEKHQRPKKKQRTNRKASEQKRLSIGSLLTMEIWRQQQRTTLDDGSPSVISQRTAQSILAGELMFRMFDPSWHVRHGSLIGILALIRAWKPHLRNHRDTHLGVWPHDMLARALCVLALDRFGDFSGATAESVSGGMIAPVREMAGQVFALVFLMSPPSFREKVLPLLDELVQHSEWETRHGAYLAMKYVVVLIPSMRTTGGLSPPEPKFLGFFLDRVVLGLNDTNDDIQSVASQVLASSISHLGFKEERKKRFTISVVQSVWQALEKTRVISSSINDLVKLLSELFRIDTVEALRGIPKSNSPVDALTSIYLRLRYFLHCEVVSIKVSILDVLKSLAPTTISLLSKKEQSKSQSDQSSVRSLYCSIIKDVCALYLEATLFLNEKKNDCSDMKVFDQSCSETWCALSDAIYRILRDDFETSSKLHFELLMMYFDRTNPNHTLKARLGYASIIALFFVCDRKSERKFEDAKSTTQQYDVLEFCLLAYLDSPLGIHCEAACLLIGALLEVKAKAHDTTEDGKLAEVLQSSLQRLRDKLYLDEISVIQKVNIDSMQVPRSSKAISDSIVVGFNMLRGERNSGKSSASRVVEFWRECGMFSHQSPLNKVTVHSMRLSTQIVGALILNKVDSLPKKLTPIVRPMMTSIQNEKDEQWQYLVCSYLSTFLANILTQEKSSDRFDGLQKTISKVLKNLTDLLIKGNESSHICASLTIGMLVTKLPHGTSLHDLASLQSMLRPLQVANEDFDVEDLVNSLVVLKSACRFLRRGCWVTAMIFDDFLNPLVHLGCSEEPLLRNSVLGIIEIMCAVDVSIVLEKVLSTLIPFLKDATNDTRRLAACTLLQTILSSSRGTAAVRPFVKSLLPTIMSMMIDPIKACAEISSGLFSLLVQVAPLVTESKTIPGLRVSADANLVTDHLIHGRKLPSCEIYPKLSDALCKAGVSLRNYQREGVSWLRFLQQVHLNGALCDSMGLGKTLQALLAVSLAHLDNENNSTNAKSLVICPSSIVGHWFNEVHRYFPKKSVLRPLLFLKDDRCRDKLESHDFIITSYEVLRGSTDILSRVDWTYCILDEGHLLKNPKTATAKAARRLRARHKLILTGTPIQNSVNELWATFDFLMPSFLGSFPQFSKEFARPIAKGHDLDAAPVDIAVGMDKLKLLHQQVLPFILRREKEQVLKELPPKIITRIPCPMSSIQEDLYNRFCSDPKGKKSISILDQMTSETSKTESSSFNAEAFRSLLYLRLLCTHPWLVKATKREKITRMTDQICTLEASGKLVALRELLRDAGLHIRDLTAADNDTSLIYCEKLSEQSSDIDDHEKILDPDLQVPPATVHPPSKRSESSRCLIFGQFTHSLDVVEELLIKRHMPFVKYLRLDGKVPISQRANLVNAFNQDDSIQLMLLTTKIGGLGLNLTGADTVIFLEHDWNPHADLQAMDRAHRIGQKRTVQVYQLVTMNSIEERTMLIQERKLAMSKAIVNTDNTSMYSMGTDRLLDIFQFRSASSSATPSPSNLDNTLDTLVERYQDEYQSLSLGEFLSAFEGEQTELLSQDSIRKT